MIGRRVRLNASHLPSSLAMRGFLHRAPSLTIEPISSASSTILACLEPSWPPFPGPDLTPIIESPLELEPRRPQNELLVGLEDKSGADAIYLNRNSEMPSSRKLLKRKPTEADPSSEDSKFPKTSLPHSSAPSPIDINFLSDSFKDKTDNSSNAASSHDTAPPKPKPSGYCQHPTCTKHASCNFPGLKRMYCSTHKQEGMIDVAHAKSRKRVKGAASREDGAGLESSLTGTRSRTQTPPSLVSDIDLSSSDEESPTTETGSDVLQKSRKTSKHCHHETCQKWASFNIRGKRQPIFCSEHKEKGMRNVKDHLRRRR